MNGVEKRTFIFLLILAGGLILISMIAGPIDMQVTAIATAASAIIISCALILYGLRFWIKKKP
ncbi:hypothetical protein [Scatolibacter rhodanostii]|uniref:hypothetical protein n=1 Tax=Scatolibacter rhodanostii TaxID=2014781 RepID=UPI000C080745|nr:hypothetical protein [Scatolibacter rhodanostii]